MYSYFNVAHIYSSYCLDKETEKTEHIYFVCKKIKRDICFILGTLDVYPYLYVVL